MVAFDEENLSNFLYDQNSVQIRILKLGTRCKLDKCFVKLSLPTLANKASGNSSHNFS